MKKFSAADLVIILCFAIFASTYQINRAGGNSLFLFSSSDAALIAGYAAATDHPELFEGDELLSNPANFRHYAIIHIPLTRFVAKFSGDYASPLVLAVGLHIFIQALGFYIFGRVLFQSRIWASLLAVLTLAHVPLPVGEFWGMFSDPLARVSYQAVLPFLLAATLYWRHKPAAWPWLLGFAGVMSYLHAVSVISWACSIWLGLWLFLPASWKLLKRLGFMSFLGIVFILGALPFSITYLGSQAKTAGYDYNLIFDIIKYRFHRGLFDIPFGIHCFFSNITFLRIFILGSIGIIYILLNHKSERRKISFLLLWLLGILITSAALPFAEQLIAGRNHFIPLLFNLVRNFRYVFLMMLIFCLWPFVLINRDSPDKTRKKTALVIGFLFVFVWSSRQIYKEAAFLKNKGYFILNASKNKSSEIIDALNAVKRLTPAGSRFFTVAFPYELAIRYYALRPLVFSFKDGGILNYTNNEGLVEWYKRAKTAGELSLILEKTSDDKQRLDAFLVFSRKLNAQFLLTGSKGFSNNLLSSNKNVIYFNNSYVLVRVD